MLPSTSYDVVKEFFYIHSLPNTCCRGVFSWTQTPKYMIWCSKQMSPKRQTTSYEAFFLQLFFIVSVDFCDVLVNLQWILLKFEILLGNLNCNIITRSNIWQFYWVNVISITLHGQIAVFEKSAICVKEPGRPTRNHVKPFCPQILQFLQ